MKPSLSKKRTYRVNARARDCANPRAKSGGSEPPSIKNLVTTALKRLGISALCWRNLAEVSRHRAKSLWMPREHKG